MANKSFKYMITWAWKTDPRGNRTQDLYDHEVTATTVNRAISKVVKDINDGTWEARDKEANVLPDHVTAYLEEVGDDDLRPSDLLVVDARSASFDLE